MKFDLNLASFALSLILGASGWVFRWNDKQKYERQQATQKAVAAAEKALNEERDFNHLRNNQIQISQGIASGFKDVEEKLDTGFKDAGKEINHLKELMLRVESYLIRNQGTNHHE